MGFCKVMVRVILIVFNILFLLAGLFLVGFGAALKAAPLKLFAFFTDVFKNNASKVENGLGEATDSVAIFMIVLGCVVVVIALLGIVGAITMSKLPLIVYVIVVILILLAQIALIVVVAVIPSIVQGKMSHDFSTFDSKFISKSGTTYDAEAPTDLMAKFWYLIQNNFECCGLSTDTEFKGKKAANVGQGVPDFDLEVPSSCCKQINNKANGVPFPLPVWNTTKVFVDFDKCIKKDKLFYNNQGCLEKFLTMANKIPIIIAAVTVGIEVILIICAIIALCQHSNKESV